MWDQTRSQTITDILSWFCIMLSSGLLLFPFNSTEIHANRKALDCYMIYYSVFAGSLHFIWIVAVTCKLYPVLCTLNAGIFTALTKTYDSPLWKQQKDWFIQVHTAYPAAAGFRFICLENPSALKSKFQNKLLSFSSAAWMQTLWKAQRSCCLNISLNLFLVTTVIKASASGVFLVTTASVWPRDGDAGFQVHRIYVNDTGAHQNEWGRLNPCRCLARKEQTT